MKEDINLHCRFCKKKIKDVFIDLGKMPSANAFLNDQEFNKEVFLPLKVYVCNNCLLVQLPEIKKPNELFTNYAYLSSYSDSWLEHAKNYVNMMIKKYKLNESHMIIEIASNDGYLLQYFMEKNIPVLGIEPAENVAILAEKKGIRTIKKFFNYNTVEELVNNKIKADLLLGNNVLAHVPDINEFVKSMKKILKKTGIITMEFPHLLQLIKHNQFDTIYHEHFSYFSFITVEKIFAFHKLTIFDVDEIPTHGGSLRIYARHSENDEIVVSDNVEKMIKKEKANGILKINTYLEFKNKIQKIKDDLNSFIGKARNERKKIVCYGAPAKGNTLLNFCKVKSELIEFAVDKNPIKQGLFLPGTHIPIKSPDEIIISKPDYLLILPWNIKEEIMEQTEYIKNWGGKFVIPIPKVMVV